MRDRQVPLGIGSNEALRRAQRLRASLREGLRKSFLIDADAPDILFALCTLLEKDVRQSSGATLGEIEVCYELVAAALWPDDHFDERAQVLSRLSYLAWRLCLGQGPYGAAKSWRDRCFERTYSQETIRDFLAIPFARRSSALNTRFFADPAVLLTTCTIYERQRNVSPEKVAADALAAFDWVEARLAAKAAPDMRFFAGDLCYSIGVALKHTGRLRDSAVWIERARAHFAGLPKPGVHVARADLMELAIAHERNDFEAILSRVRHLQPLFQQEGAVFEYETSRLLEGLALKTAGRSAESARVLALIASGEAETTNPIAHCSALIHLAELRFSEGRKADAAMEFEKAAAKVASLGVPLCTAAFYGNLAECLRDQGRLGEAIEGYRIAIAAYERGSMARGIAYIRVILAETLVAAGQEGEAIVELAQALPVIRSEGLYHESRAAAALLNESIRRQRLDRVSLSTLREQLQSLEKGGSS